MKQEKLAGDERALVARVPKDLFLRCRAKCALMDISLRAMVVAALEKYLADIDEEGKA